MQLPLALVVALLLSMAVDTALQGQFHWPLPHWRQGHRLPMGVAMAMGGNDSQILRYLPGGWPYG